MTEITSKQHRDLLPTVSTATEAVNEGGSKKQCGRLAGAFDAFIIRLKSGFSQDKIAQTIVKRFLSIETIQDPSKLEAAKESLAKALRWFSYDILEKTQTGLSQDSMNPGEIPLDVFQKAIFNAKKDDRKDELAAIIYEKQKGRSGFLLTEEKMKISGPQNFRQRQAPPPPLPPREDEAPQAAPPQLPPREDEAPQAAPPQLPPREDEAPQAAPPQLPPREDEAPQGKSPLLAQIQKTKLRKPASVVAAPSTSEASNQPQKPTKLSDLDLPTAIVGGAGRSLLKPTNKPPQKALQEYQKSNGQLEVEEARKKLRPKPSPSSSTPPTTPPPPKTP